MWINLTLRRSRKGDDLLQGYGFLFIAPFYFFVIPSFPVVIYSFPFVIPAFLFVIPAKAGTQGNCQDFDVTEFFNPRDFLCYPGPPPLLG